MRRTKLIAAVALLAVLSAACGSDDGADVRNVGGTGTGTGTATGTGTGTATGTHAEHATGTTAPECQPVGDAGQADTTVPVELREWAVLPEAEQAPGGTVAFQARNTGEHPHELYVVRGDDPGALPTTEQGAFDEAAYGEENVVGELEAFPAGETCPATIELAAGDYILLCNLVEEEGDEVLAHYRLGMRTSFTVT